jgi:beta-lactamase class A
MLFGLGHQKNHMWWKYLLIFMLGILCFYIGEKVWRTLFLCGTHYDLLNPIVVCSDRENEPSEWDYEILRENLVKKVESYTQSGTVPHLALYFRSLKHSARFSIRDEEVFEPASLLKLPIMMTILHEADHRPAFLDEGITYDTEDNYRFVTGSLDNTLQLHSSYSVRELLEKMIKYSDNSSMTLLEKKIDGLGLRDKSNTFADLGTQQLVLNAKLTNIQLISLVNIFAALYGANYLSLQSSQYALELLTHTNFDEGLVGGVPKDTRVAHKYGMRIGTKPEENELHDCGIIFHPSSPYILCVLTAGADLSVESSAIQEISKIVYDSIESIKKGQ